MEETAQGAGCAVGVALLQRDLGFLVAVVRIVTAGWAALDQGRLERRGPSIRSDGAAAVTGPLPDVELEAVVVLLHLHQLVLHVRHPQPQWPTTLGDAQILLDIHGPFSWNTAFHSGSVEGICDSLVICFQLQLHHLEVVVPRELHRRRLSPSNVGPPSVDGEDRFAADRVGKVVVVAFPGAVVGSEEQSTCHEDSVGSRFAAFAEPLAGQLALVRVQTTVQRRGVVVVRVADDATHCAPERLRKKKEA